MPSKEVDACGKSRMAPQSVHRAQAFVTEAYWGRFSVNLDLFVKQELYNSYRELGGFPQLFEIINESCGRESSVDDE